MLNVLHPGRDTLVIRCTITYVISIVLCLTPPVAVLSALFGLCWCGIILLMMVGCTNAQNPIQVFDPGILPFRLYRGRTHLRSRKRAPNYCFTRRLDRQAALRAQQGLPVTKSTDFEPRRLRRARMKAKRRVVHWHRLNPFEEALDRADKFARVESKFLHNTFVMYELRYGVDLNVYGDN